MMNAIKKYRNKMDISQVELADMVNITKGFMSRIESGKDYCPWRLTEAIATVLRCNVDTLFKPVVERKTRYVVRRTGR